LETKKQVIDSFKKYAFAEASKLALLWLRLKMVHWLLRRWEKRLAWVLETAKLKGAALT